MNVADTISRCAEFLEAEVRLQKTQYRKCPDIPYAYRGIYIIMQGDWVIYVGKGNIKDRQRSHFNKMQKGHSAGDIEAAAWGVVRDNELTNMDIWTLYYAELQSRVDETALEGLLIKFLAPTANSEVYLDNRAREFGV